MPDSTLTSVLAQRLAETRAAGLYKHERIITSAQGPEIRVADRAGQAAQSGAQHHESVLNFCANNYLGLANHPALIEAAKAALDQSGYGMASVRFICGTQDVHHTLEQTLSRFFGTGDTILYSSCFDANGGLFETLLDEQDAVISDALNHASLIDGIRLCKARRLRYAHADMTELEARLREAADSRVRLIVTDGVFSMDGDLAPLDAIVSLAEQYRATVVVDDSHATGVLGTGGRGTAEHFGVADRIDLITSTLGKALGGATGGFTTGRADVIEWLRQRSRPYLFSNALPPPIAAAALKAVALVENGSALRARLHDNAAAFRQAMTALGFRLVPGAHPIVPVMLGDAALASRMADRLLQEGIYVIGFSYPVVPKGQARIRVQLSAAHTPAQIQQAVAAFAAVGRELGVIA